MGGSSYEIMEEIYESDRTIVYRAIRKADNLPVVLKFIREKFPTEEKVAGLKHEYELLKGFTSSYIIRTYGLEEIGDRLCLVMEDCNGLSLKRYMRENILKIEDFLYIALCLAQTVREIHSHDIIHKDINPSNIIWNPDTGQVKIIDFGIASRLAVETAKAQSINTFAGSLAYISPEQTGRMNRSIDYRTDYYALGISFYEMLSGSLPFSASDSMELVHAHIAQQPIGLSEIKPQIPEPICDIVMKLMNKMAEQRYQSSYALIEDLGRCLRELNENGKINDFEIAQNDVGIRLYIQEKLYGRENEVGQLLSGFDKVCSGSVELMLVKGYSGVGKSSLVYEVHKPIAKSKGYFISGKFDQYKRNIPYSAFIQAFRELMQQILSESSEQIAVWKEKLLKVLGENGQIIIDVIPEVELIIGKQNPVVKLGAVQELNRFNYVFQNFIKVWGHKDHPIAIFLDDLQWADTASLKLIEQFILDQKSEYIFLIGAYRDNEVDSYHPLIMTLDKIHEAGMKVSYIELRPLKVSDVMQLLGDSLHLEKVLVSEFGHVCMEKTHGNPFFLKQFLQMLYKQKLLWFNVNSREWIWDIHEIKSMNVMENVVDFMTARIKQLPAETCSILGLAACIGNRFNLITLAGINKQSPEQTAVDLWPALQNGLIVPQDDAYLLAEHSSYKAAKYSFLHDRVQQAAYAMIPTSELNSLHLSIGKILKESVQPGKLSENILDIVNHLNIGRDLLVEQSECLELAKLNLKAGRQAKSSNAYDAALNYLEVVIEMLGEDRWRENYLLTLSAYEEAAEAAFLCGNFVSTEKLISEVIEHTNNILERIKIYHLKIILYSARGQFREAVELGLIILKQLGIELPVKPTKEDVINSYNKVKATIAGRSPMDFLEHNEMTDSLALAALDIFFSITPVVYLSAPNLAPILGLEYVYISLKYGNAPKSAYGYAAYSLILASVFKDYETAYYFGKLAIFMAKKPEAREVKTGTIHITAIFTIHWKEPVRNVTKLLLENYADIETGDLLHRTYGLSSYYNYAYLAGENIQLLKEKSKESIAAVSKLNQQSCTMLIRMHVQAIINLSEDNDVPWELTGEIFDEQKYLPLIEKSGDNSGKKCLFLIKSGISIMFNQYDKALSYLEGFEETENFTYSPVSATFFLNDSIIRLHYYKDSSQEQQQCIMRRVQENINRLEAWAIHAPMNYAHKVCLMKAECHRVLDETDKAIDMYDEAIKLAKKHKYINEEALANELAARFWLDKGKNHLASIYLQKAYYCYQSWGATRKLQDMEVRYPQLIRNPDNNRYYKDEIFQVRTNTDATDKLDLITITKASQAISSEIELSALLSKMMHIIVENAGAERSFFIIEKSGSLVVEAEMEAPSGLVILRPRMLADKENETKLCKAIVQYVFRTKKVYVLSNPMEQGNFINDQYIKARQPKSVICMPVMNHGKVIGVLYMENNLLFDAFSSERIRILEILSAQVAVSLENAYLYNNLKEMVDKLTKVDKLKDEFLANTSHELKTPLNAIINIADAIAKGAEGEVNEKQKANLSLITASGKRLSNLINDILDFSKLKNYELKMNFKSVNLKRIVETVVNVLCKLHNYENVQVSVEISKKIPLVQGDENRLIQVLYNLIGNALKYTEKGFVKVSAELIDDKVQVCIEDSGIGIQEDELEDIFTPFFQLENSLVRKREGTGLGLSITKYIIEAHSGKIHVESEAGKGSKFYFSVPISKEQVEEISNLVKIEDSTFNKTILEKFPYRYKSDGPHILVVDDNEGNLLALTSILKMKNYSITAVTNVKEFFEEFDRENDFSLVILDVMMPELSGYDVCVEIRKRFTLSELPILMLTARSSIKDIIIGLEAGANDYISKPFETEELLARIKTLVDLKETFNMAMKAEIAFLQSQIKPHFLYNALNTVISISRYDMDNARNLIIELGNYLRRTFDFKNLSEFVPLKNELEIVRTYIEIEKARFEERLQVEFHVPEELEDKVPMLMLQPIVENAIIHGILPKPEGGCIDITIMREDKYLDITVKDNGIGMNETRCKEILTNSPNTGIGIFNIEKRLRRLYGCGLNIKSILNKGTEINIKIPIKEEVMKI